MHACRGGDFPADNMIYQCTYSKFEWTKNQNENYTSPNTMSAILQCNRICRPCSLRSEMTYNIGGIRGNNSDTAFFFNNGTIKMYCRQHINLAGGRVELFNISARICGYNTRIIRVDGVSDGFILDFSTRRYRIISPNTCYTYSRIGNVILFIRRTRFMYC
jgi:hypothetical protein